MPGIASDARLLLCRRVRLPDIAAGIAADMVAVDMPVVDMAAADMEIVRTDLPWGEARGTAAVLLPRPAEAGAVPLLQVVVPLLPAGGLLLPAVVPQLQVLLRCLVFLRRLRP